MGNQTWFQTLSWMGGGAGDIVAQVVHTKSSFFQVPPSLNGVK